MSNGKTNVQRLVDAGIITGTNLNAEGEGKINGVPISDAEIDQLKAIKAKLGLSPLDLSGPSTGPGIWRL
jgi:hypothetical protein